MPFYDRSSSFKLQRSAGKGFLLLVFQFRVKRGALFDTRLCLLLSAKKNYKFQLFGSQFFNTGPPTQLNPVSTSKRGRARFEISVAEILVISIPVKQR